jgi:hypothetical protein
MLRNCFASDSHSRAVTLTIPELEKLNFLQLCGACGTAQFCTNLCMMPEELLKGCCYISLDLLFAA